jgi:hypothetical protein
VRIGERGERGESRIEERECGIEERGGRERQKTEARGRQKTETQEREEEGEGEGEGGELLAA